MRYDPRQLSARARDGCSPCACRSVDAVDAAALLFGRGKREPELLLQGAGEDAANRMALPPGGPCHLIHGCALGSPQHCKHLVLLRWALSLGWRLRLR